MSSPHLRIRNVWPIDANKYRTLTAMHLKINDSWQTIKTLQRVARLGMIVIWFPFSRSSANAGSFCKRGKAWSLLFAKDSFFRCLKPAQWATQTWRKLAFSSTPLCLLGRQFQGGCATRRLSPAKDSSLDWCHLRRESDSVLQSMLSKLGAHEGHLTCTVSRYRHVTMLENSLRKPWHVLSIWVGVDCGKAFEPCDIVIANVQDCQRRQILQVIDPAEPVLCQPKPAKAVVHLKPAWGCKTQKVAEGLWPT